MLRRRPLVVSMTLALILGMAGPSVAQDVGTSSAHFRFTGRGWGHGLGMSQWGAKGLADKGWTATKILTHFYRGTSVAAHPGVSAIRVGLVQNASRLRAKPDGTATYHVGGTKVLTVSTDEVWTAAPTADGKIELTGPASEKLGPYDGRVVVRFDEHSTRVRLLETDHRYRWGSLEFDVHKPGSTPRLRAVLTIPLERYIYGIGEVPSSWPVAALRAQAIAARTYALEKSLRLGDHRSGCDCTVYRSTVDQAYVGYEKEAGASGDRWVDASDATAGLVVLDGGDPVQAFYSSSSGGHTEDNDKQWGGPPIGYLRGRCDPGDYAGGGNPNNNWSVEMSEADVRAKLAKGGVDVGQITKISYLEPLGVSGRVAQIVDGERGGVRITGATGQARLSGDRFRSLLGLKTNLLGPWVFGGIRARWDALGCAPGPASSPEYGWAHVDGTPWGRAQDFRKGRLFWDADTGDVWWNFGGILARYDALREAGADVGVPASDEYAVPGGRAVDYSKGRIYWSRDHGTAVVYGAIKARYDAVGGAGFLGVPTADESSVSGGRVQTFAKGRIYWSPDHGAHVVYGSILRKYVDLGGPDGLGMPTTDEHAAGGGRAVVFERGRIYWGPGIGSHAVYGSILGRYLRAGGPSSFIGLPTADEARASDGRVSVFEHARIYWTPEVGSHVLYGSIMRRYVDVEGPNLIGLPTGEEERVGDARTVAFERGRIYWSRDYGSRVLYGSIMRKYLDLGASASFLGAPKTDELSVTGGRMVAFRKGRIYWSGATGSHVVYGGILSRYLDEGGPGGRLGLPTADEYAWKGKRRSDFERGYITWSSGEGTKVVLS